MPVRTNTEQLLRLFTHNAPSGLNARQCFTSVVEMIAIAMRNDVDRRDPGWQQREQRYLDHVQRIPALANFGQQVLALTVQALEQRPSDVLGEVYMELGASRDMGQFFTPYEISRLCAELTIGGRRAEELLELPFIRILEPACGSGGMVIAQTETLRDAGLEPQERTHTVAWDLSPTAVHMAYIQLTLLHLPAIVIHGNTLTQERFDQWPTPAHVLQGWTQRLRVIDLARRPAEITTRAITNLTTDPDLQPALWDEAS